MKQLLILSGKGGTGKTTIASSFISLLKGQHKTCFADCDVDLFRRTNHAFGKNLLWQTCCH